MTERDSPRRELQMTLEAAWKLIVEGSDPPAVRLAMLRGLVDHARALALRVGEVARVRPAKSPLLRYDPEMITQEEEST